MGEFKCDLCPCVFCSQQDLYGHMEIFTSDRKVHRWIFDYCREYASSVLEDLHDGADRTMFEIERLVKKGH